MGVVYKDFIPYLISVTSDLSRSSRAILAASRAGRASARASSASFCLTRNQAMNINP